MENRKEDAMAKAVIDTNNLSYEQWLEYRKTGIGGSDASVVCGVNKYRSPVELWLEKTGQLPYQEAGEAAYWGTQLEPVVRSEFTKRTGIEVKLVKQLLQSEEHHLCRLILTVSVSTPTMAPVSLKLKQPRHTSQMNGRTAYPLSICCRYSTICQ